MALKVLVACANGAGTSLMMKLSFERAAKSLKLAIQNVHHCALSEAKSSAPGYDVLMIPQNFIDMFKHAMESGVSVIGLRNVLSEAEIKEKLLASGLVENNQLL
ncbi:MAG: PTS sugar transporter subunit IIB [Synergistaceae bacterium]|jgi:PTS system ascorbate-specific IIB component|nr:PTS sugar transporter subunit IIB [Synergistaceae bacterium]